MGRLGVQLNFADCIFRRIRGAKKRGGGAKLDAALIANIANNHEQRARIAVPPSGNKTSAAETDKGRRGSPSRAGAEQTACEAQTGEARLAGGAGD